MRQATIERLADTTLPTVYGDFRAVGYHDPELACEQIALVYGDIADHDVLTRLHSECLTGDVFGCNRCECGEQFAAAMRAIVAEGAGVLVYLQGHEGRGIGLLAKLKAMHLQEKGLDTVEANVALGLPVDARDYHIAADILRDLGIRSVRLLSNNPKKLDSLRRYGIEITERVPLLITPNEENLPYLRTKRARLDHILPQLDDLSTSSTFPNESTKLARASRPLSAVPRDGRPTTPDVV
jgi:GTP cyclohydrolase II